jgi:hypothetical protein
MKTVYIDNQGGCDYIYQDDEWKIYAYGEDFDEHFVINANREYTKVEEAKWYKDMMDIKDDFDNMWISENDEGFMDELKDIAKYYGKDLKMIQAAYEAYDDEVKMLNALNPGKTFKKCTICGYCQRDWNEVIYEVSDEKNIKNVEAFYFGMIAEVYTEGISAIFTDDDLWNAEREGKLVEAVKEALDIPSDEDITIMESDGYITTTNWKEVC